jgi:hypothetical protein
LVEEGGREACIVQAAVQLIDFAAERVDVRSLLNLALDLLTRGWSLSIRFMYHSVLQVLAGARQHLVRESSKGPVLNHWFTFA